MSKEGFLFKEGGGKMQRWQKRWCVISGSDFIYYKKKGGAETGRIHLPGCSDIRISPYKKRKTTFQLQTPTKLYHLYSPDGDDEAWVKALNDCKNPKNGATKKDSDAKPEKKDLENEKSPRVEEKKKDEKKKEEPKKPVVKAKDLPVLFDTQKYKLPEEIMLHVCKCVGNGHDLLNMAMVCKHWKTLAFDDEVWKHMYVKHSGGSADDKPAGQTWKKYYEEYHARSHGRSHLTTEQIEKIKDLIPFLHKLAKEEDSKIIEFHQLWTESFPEMDRQFWADRNRQFKLFLSSDFTQISWYIGGVQAEFIQGLVDFFWNVGAPESEIDRLNDLGGLMNPEMVGSWIDMSEKGGMDGGWYFPVDVTLDCALEACDSGDALNTVKAWAKKNNLDKCYHIKRDMGAAPPRQTELKFKVPSHLDFEGQCNFVLAAIKEFGFAEPPKDMWATLTKSKKKGLRFSVITTTEGFARVGVMFPLPPTETVNKLCTGDSKAEVLAKISDHLRPPTYVEYYNLAQGYGYGVYTTGHGIGFLYCVNGPDSVENV